MKISLKPDINCTNFLTVRKSYKLLHNNDVRYALIGNGKINSFAYYIEKSQKLKTRRNKYLI